MTMHHPARKWIDSAAATLAATPRPSELRGIAKAARHASDDDLAVSAIDCGRDALEAAALEAARAAELHVRVQRAAARHDELRRALELAAGHAEKVALLANLSPAGMLAPEFVAAARLQVAAMQRPEPKRRGSPGKPVHRAAALAVAKVWSAAVGQAIPTGGLKSANHPLAALLRAVSIDLFGHAGALSPEYLRSGRKSKG